MLVLLLRVSCFLTLNSNDSDTYKDVGNMGWQHHRERFSKQKFLCYKLHKRQTLYRSIGVINKIIWEEYYTDSCSATVIILSNVAPPKNCRITWWQHYFKTLRRLNVSTEQCLLCFWWLAFSLSGIEPMRFCTVLKEIDLEDFCKCDSVSACSGLA